MRREGWTFESWFVYGGIGSFLASYALLCIYEMHVDGLIWGGWL